ncbi:aspartate kinase [Ammoniphilus oxalaticus]|uniref:Aspartokinase n=1 Tax=Ammoniphilus oxalaticus TaxID=66863 RepID=A0A419SJY3_9BACL|nr:aspartate kinase [Ammoniphilus oxalaticus]RKD24285.1 aspartate kinase [Ammoniphilus oxalaticus]
MKTLVQKFGGSSLSSLEGREEAIGQIRSAIEEGYAVCVVVSAMGRQGQPYATDTLLTWMNEHGSALEAKDLDLLLHCGEVISATTLASMLNQKQIPTTVFTGGQAGIITNREFGNAQIQKVEPDRLRQALQDYKVVVVTGFQGRTLEWEITTLGRGGSDTTATALGVALQAERVDIFTDVSGVMTADPQIVEEAQQLEMVTYTEIANMAYQGAKVIHPRAVELAMQGNIPIRIRSTFTNGLGTLVTHRSELERGKGVAERLITGIAHISNITQIKVYAKEGQYDLQLSVFKAMAEHEISVDFINVNPIGVAYTVRDAYTEKAVHILREMGYEPKVIPRCAKVSLIGAGMAGVPGVMAQITEALNEKDIQILQCADSHTTIWVLVKNDDTNRALRALHHKFNLHKVSN